MKLLLNFQSDIYIDHHKTVLPDPSCNVTFILG